MEALDGLEMLTVDIGLAKLKFTTGLHGNVQVLGEDAGSQTVFAVIGHSDDFIEGFKFHQRNHRTEGLLMDDIHILTTVVEHRSSIEITLGAYTMATTEQFGTLTDGTHYFLRHALKSTLFYQRTHINTLVGTGVTHFHSLHLLHQYLREGSFHLFLHIDTLCIITDLTVVTNTTVDDPLGSTLQVGILHHDSGRLTTQFQTHLGDIL